MTVLLNDNSMSVSDASRGEAHEEVAPAGRPNSPIWVAFVVLFVAGVFAFAWFAGSRTDAGPVELIPVASAPVVPDFSLIAQDGRTVTLADFQGKVWLANFIYAQCPGPCPTLTARMAAVQKSLAARKDNIRLVSFSLDPLRDTTAVLTDYARRFHVDTSWWFFLTGPSEEDMHKLVEKGFLQSVVPGDDDNPMMHSNYVAVMDQQGRIRAFYDGMETSSKPRILSAVRQLLSETDGP